MKKALLYFGLLLLSFSLLTACGPSLEKSSTESSNNSSDSEKYFVIGQATSLSGGTASYGEGAKRGIELAVKEFNAAGGYNGVKAKYIAYDDETKPEKNMELIQRLVSQDKAVALLGSANSGNGLAHIEYLQKNKIAEVFPYGTATAITTKFKNEAKNYVFRIAPFDQGQVTTILDWLYKKNGFTKVGLLHDTSGYGQGGKTDVLAQLKERNIKPTAVESFQIGDNNMESQLSKMKKANIEAIIVYGLAPEMAQVLKSAEKIDYKPKFIGSWAFGDPAFKNIAGDLVNNDVYFVQSFTVDQNEKTKEFHNKVVNEYKEDMYPIATAQGYDAANIVLSAIKKVGYKDTEKVRDAIEELNDFNAVTTAPSKPFTKDNHEALQPEHMFIATYKDGQIVIAK
ncbi:ABC transporter substrate-binding protein [Neobacillus cucumis]|uniref:ABC transporter substrate-binding protein n=1 Tax=Neobacillus cucumis TaxID=1740721 RepID=UPI0018E0553E|nr:ABC transporter substrate-binding protein [Neobacillus cucumis]MBI0579857.1 ABC transporter substrate-binding protein [Neobacillus cucumis]